MISGCFVCQNVIEKWRKHKCIYCKIYKLFGIFCMTSTCYLWQKPALHHLWRGMAWVQQTSLTPPALSACTKKQRFVYWTCQTISFIGIKVNEPCIQAEEGCIQHAICNSSKLCQCSIGYSYNGNSCKYLKSIYLYYFPWIKEIRFWISLICKTDFNAISEHATKITDYPYVNDQLKKIINYFAI